MIDESTAMSIGRDSERAARLGFYATGIGVFVLWNLGTADRRCSGASWLSEPRVLGLDAAAPAAFLALLAPRLRGREAWAVALAAAMVALSRCRSCRSAFPVLIAALVGVVAGLLRSARPASATGADGIGRGGARVTLWIGILVGLPGCYLLKLAGLSVPKSVLERARGARIAALLPVVLLSALVAVQTFSLGQNW